jgi:hypothetical protein
VGDGGHRERGDGRHTPREVRRKRERPRAERDRAEQRRRDALELTAAERDYHAFRDDRAEFDEWVVRARLPESVLDRERADAETLADLVDYAIDADVGVVEDTRTGAFYAVTPELLVAFDPPELHDDPSPLSADALDDLFDLSAVLGGAEPTGSAGDGSVEAEQGVDDAAGTDAVGADADEPRAGVTDPED